MIARLQRWGAAARAAGDKLRGFSLGGGVDDIGRRGEKLAAAHLKRQGYRILARNAVSSLGELDLIALTPDRRTVAFIEVKSAAGSDPAPERRVNAEKRRRLTRLAASFAKRHRLTDRPLRFDVVAIIFNGKDTPTVRHHPGAFSAHG